MIKIIYVENILEKSKKQVYYIKDNGKVLDERLEELKIPYEDKNIFLNGSKMDNARVLLADDDEVIVVEKIKDPVSAVATVASLLAMGGQAWGASSAIWSALGIIGVTTIVGMSVYSAVAGQRKQPFLSGGFGLDEGSPTYSWGGIKSSRDVGLAVPIVYGKHRIGGNIINTYIRSDGEKEYLNVLLALCEGEIESITDVEINNNDSDNYDGITLYKRYGTNSQTVISNFNDEHNLYTVDVTLSYGSSHTYTTNDSDVEGFEIYFQFPYGLYEQDSSSGKLKPTSCQFKIEWKLTSASTWNSETVTYNYKSRTSFKRIYRKVGLTAGEYDIKVTKQTADSTTYVITDATWLQVDEIKTDDIAYVNTALLGVEALATDQLNGGMPNITCLVKGRKVECPVIQDSGGNTVDWEDYYWDPVAEKYKKFSDDSELTEVPAGGWFGDGWFDDDGWFESTGEGAGGTLCSEQYCANPVWCLRDLLINNRYGLGDYIDSSDIDADEWCEMAKYCEEKVSDGDGGYEKRFVLNIVIDSPTKALDLLNQICMVFRGILYYSEGKIKIKIEKEDDPVQTFGMGNIIEGTFKMSWKSLKEVPNVIEIQYLDEEKNYQNEVLSVVDSDTIGNGEKKKSIRLFGTKRSYILREGKYHLRSGKNINRGVEFKAGIDGVICEVGDIIKVSHDVPLWGYSGRVVSGTSTSVTLDHSINLEDGKSYKIRVQHSDDTMEEFDVTNGTGETSVINIDGTFSTTPLAYEKYIVGETSKVGKPFRIVTMKVENNGEVGIYAVEYDEDVYTSDSINIPTDNYSSLTFDLADVENLNLTEQLVKLNDGTIETVIDVWFNKPLDSTSSVRLYERAKIYFSEDGGSSWIYKGETLGEHFQIMGSILDGATYKVAVVSVGGDGVANAIADSPQMSITIVGKQAPPSDVSSFVVRQYRDRLAFSWTEVDDVDLWGYEIRIGGSWASGAVLVSGKQGNNWETPNIKEGSNLSYWIKAIDTNGNYSDSATEATISVIDIPFRNIVKTTSEQTSWSGTKTHTTVDGSNLKIEDGYTTGTYETSSIDCGYKASFKIDLDVVVTITDSMAFDSSSTYAFDTSGTRRFSGEEQPGGWSVEISTSDDGSTWSSWEDWTAGDYTCRYYKLKLTLTRDATDVDLQCSTFEHTADLPDVDEFGSDSVTTASSGKSVTFSKTFHTTPAVICSITSGTGIGYRISSLSTSGFTITIYDSSGSAVTGAFSWHAHGI